MTKDYCLYIAYAPYGENVKGFTPTVFRMPFDSWQDMLDWMLDPGRVQSTIEGHALGIGIDTKNEAIQKAIYLNPEMSQEFGFPNDGTTLTDVVCDMFRRWIDYQKKSGEFPDV